MPGSNCSGFFTASQQAMESMRISNAASLAAKDAEMEEERKKKDAEMDAMKSQMAEMANTSRQTSFVSSRNNNLKVGINSLSNRFYLLNNKIPLQWFNQSIDTFKIHCKKLFLPK